MISKWFQSDFKVISKGFNLNTFSIPKNTLIAIQQPNKAWIHELKVISSEIMIKWLQYYSNTQFHYQHGPITKQIITNQTSQHVHHLFHTFFSLFIFLGYFSLNYVYLNINLFNDSHNKWFSKTETKEKMKRMWEKPEKESQLILHMWCHEKWLRKWNREGQNTRRKFFIFLKTFNLIRKIESNLFS